VDPEWLVFFRDAGFIIGGTHGKKNLEEIIAGRLML
jgi:hypothetical protein